MATGSSTELRRRLVEHLRRRGFLTDPRIMEAFLAVPREVFLPEHALRLGTTAIYRDEAIVVRRDPASGLPQSSSSQPAIMALMLQMLDARPGHRVLEIGAGTGYNAALLDRLTDPGGLVITLDIDGKTAAGAAAALERLGAGAHVVVADGAAGFPCASTFDRIEVTASSADVPRAWHDQLALEGRLVVPLRLSDAPDSAHAITVLRKTPQGFDSIDVTCGGFMPLRRPERPVAGSDAEPAVSEPLLEPDLEVEEPARPEDEPELPQQPFFQGFGPPIDIDRQDASRLRITVRYSDDPRLEARWVLEREDHRIAVDLPDP